MVKKISLGQGEEQLFKSSLKHVGILTSVDTCKTDFLKKDGLKYSFA